MSLTEQSATDRAECPLWVRSGAGDWAQPFDYVRNTPKADVSFDLRLPPQRSAGLRRRGDRCNGMVLCPKAQAGNLVSARSQLGALQFSEIEPAPGRYVKVRND
jgi:hypothetical protein